MQRMDTGAHSTDSSVRLVVQRAGGNRIQRMIAEELLDQKIVW